MSGQILNHSILFEEDNRLTHFLNAYDSSCQKLMRGRRSASRSTFSSSSSGSGDDDSPIQNVATSKKALDEQAEILTSRYPLEESGVVNGKTISITQRAIICCISKNAGVASEGAVLRFLKKHWSFIKRNSAKDYRDTANWRVLRINFNAKKNGFRLFREVERGSGNWCTMSDSGETKMRLAECEPKFDDMVISLLHQEQNGITLDEMAEMAKDFIDVEGFCRDLNGMDPTGKRRLRALMLVKRRLGFVEYVRATDRWTIKGENVKEKVKEKDKSGPSLALPESLPSLKISDLTISELYKIMIKKNGTDISGS